MGEEEIFSIKIIDLKYLNQMAWYTPIPQNDPPSNSLYQQVAFNSYLFHRLESSPFL
jgi:hypothetical protein